MGISFVVSGLVTKHAELAGLIQFHKAEIERITLALKHLDVTLKLFAPEIDLRSLGTKRVSQSCIGGFKYFRGRESHKLVLDQLRRATKPLTTTNISTTIMAARGIDNTREARISINRTLTGTLRRLERRGLVKDVGRAENGLSTLWQIA